MRNIILMSFFLLPVCAARAGNVISAQKGTLDLSNWNWDKDGIADLNGEWEFYWGKFYSPDFFKNNDSAIQPNYIPVPSFWNDFIPDHQNFHSGFGYATYRLKVLCPPGQQNLGIKFLTIASACKVFVNGKQILAVEIGRASCRERVLASV